MAELAIALAVAALILSLATLVKQSPAPSVHFYEGQAGIATFNGLLWSGDKLADLVGAEVKFCLVPFNNPPEDIQPVMELLKPSGGQHVFRIIMLEDRPKN